MSVRVDSPSQSLPIGDSSHYTDQKMSVQVKLEPMEEDESLNSHSDSLSCGREPTWLGVPSTAKNCCVNTDAERQNTLSHPVKEQQSHPVKFKQQKRAFDDAGSTESDQDNKSSVKVPKWNVRVKLKEEKVCDEEDWASSEKDTNLEKSAGDQSKCVNSGHKGVEHGRQNSQLPARPFFGEGLGLESTVRRLWTLHSTALAAAKEAKEAKEDKMAAVPSSSNTNLKLNHLKKSGAANRKGVPKEQSRATAKICEKEDDEVCEGSSEADEDHLPLYFQSSNSEDRERLPSTPLPASMNEEMEDTKLYQCNVCDEAFEDAFGLRTHIAQFKHRQSSRCGVCQRVFGRCSSLTVHLRTHTDERPWKCRFCPSAFKGQSGLIYHERTHSSQKPYLCEVCFSSFTDSSSLHRHKRVHSGEKPYQCAHCPMAFAAKSSWVYHTRSHTGEKHYKCDQCPAAFTRPQHLKNHMLHHTSDMPFRCKICSETFSLRAQLVEHESKQHAEDRPFRCDLCEAAFSEAEELRQHTLDHGATFKPYKCEACPAEFLQQAQLKVHSRKHTSAERPFKCQECGASFTNSASLWKHRKIHNGEGPFVCPQCPSSFTRAANLRRHQKTHEKAPEKVSDSESQDKAGQ